MCKNLLTLNKFTLSISSQLLKLRNALNGMQSHIHIFELLIMIDILDKVNFHT